MKKHNSDYNNCLHVYIEGANPSGRDIQNFCIMIESSLVVSVLNYQCESDNEFSAYKINNEYEGFLKEKYVTYDYGVDETVERLTNLVIASVSREPFILDPKREFEFKKSSRNMGRLEDELEYLRHELHRTSRHRRDRGTANLFYQTTSFPNEFLVNFK